MVAGSVVDLRDHYTPLHAGAVLWHVYPSTYDPRAFNPKSRNRFAVPEPSGRSMFYAGDSSACALWEAVLRNLVVKAHQPQHIDPALLEGRSIARLKLAQEISILDLRAPHFRHLSTSPARHSEWQRLCVVPERDYSETHAAARELLAAAPRAAGLCWHSRQLASQTAYVLYAPPLAPTVVFDALDVIEINQPEGWELVDEALEIMGVERLDGSALAKELADELPPEDVDDE